jgi:MFS family permease
MNGVGGAAGTLFSGILTDALSWRWVLLINVPIGIAGALLAYRVVADRRNQQRESFDLLGALLLTVGLLIATYGGVTAGSEGFGSAEALVPIIVGSALIGVFQLVEKRAKDPLVPFEQLTRDVRVINIIVLLFSSSLFAMWFASSLYLQQVLALSPLETGLAFLPMTLVIFLAARPAGKLASRVGVKTVLASGLTMLTVGLVLMSRIGPGGSAVQYVIVPGILVAAGIGFSVVSSTIAATMSAGPAQAGLASSLVNTARQVGGGLGLAILLSIATRHTSLQIGDGAPVPEALTDGFSLAYLVGAGLVGAAAILTILLLPGAKQPEQRAFGKRVMAGAAVAIAAFLVIEVAVPRSQAADPGAFTLKDTMKFVTEPNLHPPQMVPVIKASSDVTDGYIMTANFLDVTKPPIVGQSGPLMLDHALQPVWYKPVPTDVVAANLETYEYEGKPVLGWWQGVVSATGEIESGKIVIVDQSYKQIATLEGTDGWVISLHAMDIRDGTAWVTANKNVPADLSSEGGVNHGVLVDSALQQYDLKTGKLLYSWDATKHIPMSDSETQPPPNGFPWDAYHINALDLTEDGRALVSMRNTSAMYLFDLKSGKIEWQLGGKHSSFKLGEDAAFEWQHDAELVDDDTVTLFDNHCCEITGAGEYLPAKHESRGLELKLDKGAMTATVAEELTHGETFKAQYMGNVQQLDNGHTFVGWGQVPFMSEYDSSGKLIFDAAFPIPNMSYRSHLREWVGKPTTKPKAAVRGSQVLVSWNGATEVRRWKVLADGREVAASEKKGFETAIDVPEGGTKYEVQALDASGGVLATSNAVTR